MTDEQEQAEHARIFGEVSRQVMRATLDFAKDIAPALTPFDVARIYLATGSQLAAMVTDRVGAVALLRELADRIEQDDGAAPN